MSATVLSRVLLVGCAGLFPTGCVSPIGTLEFLATPEIIQSSDRYEREYLLRPGNQVEVFVYQYPEFSRTTTIRPDGTLTLPVLDDISASGLTPRELDNTITEALSGRLRNPEVTVFVQNIEEPMVYVMGEVGNPTAIPLRQAENLAQAVTLASGITNSGSIRNVAVIRLQEDGYLRAIPLVQEGNGQSSFYLAMSNTRLEAGDLVFVPESTRSQFIRAIQDFINTPLGALNQILAPYLQIQLIREINENT